MAKRIPDYLRLHVESEERRRQPPQVRDFPFWESLRAAFAESTGWDLVWSPDEAATSTIPRGSLELIESEAAAPDNRPLDREQATRLVGGLQSSLDFLQQTRHRLWQCEAELATAIPVTLAPDEQERTAVRLEAVLRGGAAIADCQAAALYLLDETTTHLTLRASSGLPSTSQLEPTRPLRGAVADLEALVGHAVVLEDTRLLPHWKVPEPFLSAVCVPVSTDSTPLGTLWFFCERVRDFSEQETELIELIAGRLTADLERAALLRELRDSKRTRLHLRHAEQWQRDRLPCIEPPLGEWQLDGWATPPGGVSRSFYDWSILPDGRLAVRVGLAHGTPIEAALGAAGLQAVLTTLEPDRLDPANLMQRVMDWAVSAAAEHRFSLFYGVLDPQTGELRYASAGDIAVLRCGDDRVLLPPAAGPKLGEAPEADIHEATHRLGEGDGLLVFTAAAQEADPSPDDAEAGLTLHRLAASARKPSPTTRSS